MLDTLLNLTFAALLFLAVGQKTAERQTAAIFFVFLAVAHDQLLGHLNGLLYFGSAAIVDLLFIYGSFRIAQSRMLDSLIDLSYIFILINFLGWVVWFNYLPGFAYQLACLGLYLWAVYLFLRKEGDYVGSIRLHRRGSYIRFNNSASYQSKSTAEG